MRGAGANNGAGAERTMSQTDSPREIGKKE